MLAIRAHHELLRAARVARSAAWACRTSAAAGQAVGALVAVLLFASVKLAKCVSCTSSKDCCRDRALIRSLRIIIEALVSILRLLLVTILLLLVTILLLVALALLALLLVITAFALLLFLLLVFLLLNLGLEEFDFTLSGSQALLELGILSVFTLLGFKELLHGALHLSEVLAQIGELVFLELLVAVLAHVLDHLCGVILGLDDFFVLVLDLAAELLNLTILGAGLHALGSLGPVDDLFGLVTKMAASTFVLVLAAAAGSLGSAASARSGRGSSTGSSSSLAAAFSRDRSLAVALKAATEVLSIELMVAPSVPEGGLSLGLDSLLVC